MTVIRAEPARARSVQRAAGLLPPRVVLLAAGPTAPLQARLEAAAPALAAALALRLAAPLETGDPPGVLNALQTGEKPGQFSQLIPLPLDPGLTLADGSCWAELLGAWRQPVVLLLAEEQLGSGVAAATTALLRQASVPLLGLVQWGLPWQAELRRLEAMPWLGALASEPQSADQDQQQAEELAQALRPALHLACAQLRSRGH